MYNDVRFTLNGKPVVYTGSQVFQKTKRKNE